MMRLIPSYSATLNISYISKFYYAFAIYLNYYNDISDPVANLYAL